MAKTTIVIEDGRITITTDDHSISTRSAPEEEIPFILEPEDEEIPKRPHLVTEDPADIILDRANAFADQMADKVTSIAEKEET